MSRVETLLFLQRSEVLAEQRRTVEAWCERMLPGTRLVMAGRPGEVPQGLVVQAVIAPTLSWLPEALARLERYEWIHFLSSGVEAIWAMPFDKHAVILTRSAGIHAPAMSEYVIGAMLFFAKRFGHWTRAAGRSHWERQWLGELTGARVTILGMGRVGRMVAERCAVFGMRVVGLRRTSGDDVDAAESLALEGLDAALSETDFLVVCLPLTDRTRGFVDADRLARLPRGAVVIDVSRGGVVDEAALVSALDEARLGGAALDVFAEEPLPANSPLWGREDVLLTPHVAGTTPFYLERALALFLDNLSALEAGDAPVTPVNVDAGY